MKLVVLSDTHMLRMAKKLPERLILELKDADAIIHAGDWMEMSVWDMLQAYAPTDGVAGNNDGQAIIAKFGYRKVMQFGGVRIGVVHGHGSRGREGTETTAFHAFARDEVDVIIFGHSHVPLLKRRDGILLFNPGSPTDKRRQPLYSFGILRIEGSNLSAEHIRYENKG
ncbi:phosphoesterase [Paenibacillus baekrokdamisoli]|uniref:Phosphoesterase n=1 Tax=Paenibacillus baekrokdamisoli TaxID=1712516 RepID=A0A3G9IXU6_9BACL|nr:metallophosphoesterase [Paenibacillus baekrokdamisoli]MBB3068890.1 hypothetical protein [Paenibacillus baekrokdamisoli]BBH23717.1 phosphoesterase [Paenibacillus baekrokdamisoli]